MAKIQFLSNEDLHLSFKQLKAKESELLIEVLEHIREVHKRKLFLRFGFTSLYSYLTQGLGYEESAAYRRIQAAKLIEVAPQIKEDLAQGKLTLTSLSEVHSAIKQEEKRVGKAMTPENQTSLLQAAKGLSKQETQKMLTRELPDLHRTKPEKKKERSNNSLELSVTLNAEQREKFERCRDLLANSGPSDNMAHVIERLCDFYLDKKDLTKSKAKKASSEPTVTQGFGVAKVTSPAKASASLRKPVPRAVKRFVFERDQGRCQVKTGPGKVCNSTYQVEIDHTQRVKDGGGNEPTNLRCCCRVHNQNR